MVTDKANILCILKILEDYSDESHILNARDIQDKLKSIYDKTADRRTIYSAVDTLIGLGYEISTFEDNGCGYYLIDRPFDPADVRLLTDAVCSFEYISKKQTDELVGKLQAMLPVHERKRYGTTNILRADKKSPNSQIFLNIELLDQAIDERKKVSFIYTDYDYNKKLVPRRLEPYIANPYAMIVESEHYYLVMILEGKTEPSFYRIDMMKELTILDEEISISRKDADLDNVSKVVYAHAGKPEQIRLRCDKKALRYCLERFGLDIMIIPLKDGETFETVFKASPAGIVYWALQQIEHVEVLAPESLRSQVISAIKANKYGA